MELVTTQNFNVVRRIRGQQSHHVTVLGV